MNMRNSSSFSKDESESIRAVNGNNNNEETINIIIKSEGEIILLEESNKRQHLLSVLLADIKWTINPEGKVTYISPFIENCIANDAKYVIKKIVSRYLTQPSIIACLIELEELTDIMRTSKYSKSRTLIVDTVINESNIEKVEITSSAIFDKQGHVVGIQGLCSYIPK